MVCRQQLAPGKLPRVMIVDNTMASSATSPLRIRASGTLFSPDAFSIRIRQRNALSEPESRLSPVRSSVDPRALTGEGRARKGDQLYEVKE